ncbi:MAG: CcdB family protein [Pseudomonadota bacterium]
MGNYPVHQLTGDVEFDLVVVIQSDFYDFIDTRVVIPLRPRSSSHLDELINPILEFEGHAHVLLTERIGTIPTTALGNSRGDLKGYSVEISRALDRLMTGF